jgi:hypothetical protein
MASAKKRRKQANVTRKQRTGGNRGVHPDGDRRRRGGKTVEQALAEKRAMQNMPGMILAGPETGGGEQS